MDAFAQAVEGWHDFYHVIGDAAAALMGLLFVSLSLNVHAVTRKSNADLRFLAAQTFASFLCMLMFAVLFLIPDQGPLGLGLPMLGIDLIVLYVVFHRFFEMRRDRARIWRIDRLVLRFAIPPICFVGIIVIAMSLLMGKTSGPYCFVPIVILLFWIAILNAWELLLRLGKPTERS